MPKLIFDKTGEHFYETGVDHCVLFVKSADGYKNGVVWNGISSITESPDGAEATDIYADNIKYLSLRSIENFKGTIEAYMYPDEFAECDGSKEFGSKGVRVGQQSRSTFCFAYRTKKGSDTDAELGYKLHIVYGATVSPSERGYETVNDSPEAASMSWEFSTVPVECKHFTNVSHIEIDSTLIDAKKLEEIEGILFGTDGSVTPAVPCEAIKTADIEIVEGKKYFTRSESAGLKPGYLVDVDGYRYFEVEKPAVGEIGTYFEVLVEGSDEKEIGDSDSRIILPDELYEILTRENKKK